MDTDAQPEAGSLSDETRGLTRLVIDLIADGIPGTPSRVVSVLTDVNFDTTEAARRLNKTPHYVRTNLARFVLQARERYADDRAIRLLVALILSTRQTGG